MPQPIPPPDESGHTTTTPVPLYWAAYGAPSAPPLLVIHGGPGAHHDYLLPQMLRLVQVGGGRRAIFYDQRGGGRSRTESREPVTWQTHVEDLSAVARELSTGPLRLVGYSWGGLLSVLYALEASKRTELCQPDRIALIDPAPFSRRFRTQFEQEFSRRQQSPAVAEERARLTASGLQQSDPDAYRQRLFELSVAGYFAHPDRARDLTPFRVIGRIQQSVWESLGDYDLFHRLHAIECPVLVVHGRDDPIPAQSAIEGARAMNAELVLLDDCGHVPYVEKPDDLFTALERFFIQAAPLHL